MLVTAAVCSGSDSAPTDTDIGQALSTELGNEVSASGYLFLDKDGLVRLCEMLLESSPPQCGGERIELADFDSDTAPNIQRVQQPSEINTTAWTDEVITITGTRGSDGLEDVTLGGT